MKKFVLILCALFVAQVAFGALDRDRFDYTDTPEYQAIPATKYSNVSANAKNGGVIEEVTTTKTVTQKGKKRLRFRNEGSSWINTYWNFGQPVYGEIGRF